MEAAIDLAGRGVAWIVLVHVVLVAVNVILRYLLQIGPVALQELEWHLMSPIALFGMAYALRHDDHVRVDILYDRYPPPVRAFVDFLASVATVAIAIVIIKLSFGFIHQSWSEGEVSPDPGGLPFRWLLKSFIPMGFFLLALQAMAIACRRWVVLWGGG
jgi:TRAP-type mannitol/chloroaromatic compound transport system permease small subunit